MNATNWPARARRELRREQQKSGSNFAPQIMLDSEPASEKPWSAACEHFTKTYATDTTPGIMGDGVVVVLSDPAPFLQGGYKGLGERSRADGTKDYWSLSVWKIRPRGEILDRILVDGAHSQEWGHKQGADEAARLMKKWRTNLFFSENADEHYNHMTEASFKAAVSLRRSKDNGPLKFASYNRADRKNVDFLALAEAAKLGQVWICCGPRDETQVDFTCPPEFVYGDGEHTGFLTQARKWRNVGQGKTNLRFDDDADCAARVMDAALADFTPTPEALRRRKVDDFFFANRGEQHDPRSRYCGM